MQQQLRANYKVMIKSQRRTQQSHANRKQDMSHFDKIHQHLSAGKINKIKNIVSTAPKFELGSSKIDDKCLATQLPSSSGKFSR